MLDLHEITGRRLGALGPLAERVDARSRRQPSRRLVAPWRCVLTLALLVPAWIALAVDELDASQHNGPQQVAQPADELAEALARALGMTLEEVEAFGLSPEEMRSLLTGFSEQTVVVGSRTQRRSTTESAVPVDVLAATDLGRQGAGDLKEQLRTVIPLFNVNTRPIGGASTVVRPVTLRNLAPDHTLVLVNGKRRHRSSIIDYHGGNGVAYGSQASASRTQTAAPLPAPMPSR